DEAKARQVLGLAKAPDSDFQAIAEKHSIHPNAKNDRGNLGYLTWSTAPKEIMKAASLAKEKEVIGPVKTIHGYHILKVLDKRPGKVLDFYEVESQVRGALETELAEGFVDELRKKAK